MRSLPSMVDGLKLFLDLTKRLADTLQILLEEVKDTHHKLPGILHTSSSSLRITLPVNKVLLDPVKVIWHMPASITPTCKRANKKYYVPSKDAEFLFSHPSSNSVVDAVNSCGQYHNKSTSYDRDWKIFDLFGRNEYSSAILRFRIANYQTLMVKYDHMNFAKLNAFIDHLPKHSGTSFRPSKMRGSSY